LFLGDWWEVLIFPVFCVAMVYIIGHQFGIWPKVKGFLDSHGSGRLDFGGMLKGLKGISFEGIGDLFRGWFT